jgi:hypothetical protein
MYGTIFHLLFIYKVHQQLNNVEGGANNIETIG